MSYLLCLCLLAYIGVQHILRCVFVLFVIVYVASFSGLNIVHCPFLIGLSVFSNVYLTYLPD